MKRKIEDSNSVNGKSKKRALSVEEAQSHFRKGLFHSSVLEEYKKEYAESQPYKHAVIQSLIDPTLLRNVRNEIREHLSFTPKETDIYKIYQSGDLANLDGLDDSSLRRLPSLLTLRDSLYSPTFRKYISAIANAGPLSGRKTDMAINVYTPGCHLLCHDDVIGSRRVSYILYLTDPDRPWKPEWGGALRLYPTQTFKGEDGTEIKVPSADFSVSIPPAFNQLSFFAVQPGESFHDVEEVYRRAKGEDGDDGGRVRMAISGWYHIPQEGEEGHEPGLEEKLAEKSSLMQLQSKSDEFDLPRPQWQDYGDEDGQADETPELSEEDLTFLLKYMTPTYLTPDTVEELSTLFAEESSLRLSNLLSASFAAKLRAHLEALDTTSSTDTSSPSIPQLQQWHIARPPHKHRFLYRQPSSSPIPAPTDSDEQPTPLDALLTSFFPSPAFKKWLSLATGLTLSRRNVLARRFRRGMDYTLATSYEEVAPQLEVCLGVTPSGGWGEEGEEEGGEGVGGKAANGSAGGKAVREEPSVGGYEVYMAGDDEDDGDDAGSDDGVEVPAGVASGGGKMQAGSASTGAGNRRGRSDPAIYRSGAGDGEEDDGVLFSMPAGWNNMSVVLRDTGVLRFVKCVSRAARGDRWDVCGEFGVVVEGEGEDEEAE